MSKAVYLVAKYVPDLFKNEPVNIGIIVWVDGTVALRFLGQRADGTINGSLVRDRFRSLANYKQWVESWMRMVIRHQLDWRDQRKTVEKSSPEFLEALASSGRGNYILERGGELLEDANSTDVGEIADFLFSRLVDAADQKADYKTPEEVRDDLLTEAKVIDDERVIRGKRIHVEFNGKKLNPEFNVYIGNGTPEILGQMVPLTAQPKQVQNYTQASAFRFLSVLEANILPQDRCIAFVYSQEDRSNIDLIHESVHELSQVATVVNISTDRARAIKQIQGWVESVKPHH